MMDSSSTLSFCSSLYPLSFHSTAERDMRSQKMTQMWLIWWPKNISATKNGSEAGAAAAAAAAAMATTTEPSPSCYGACLRRVVRKVKKQGKAMLRAAGVGRQSAFQCRYDPLSYSLNFDRRMDDEDYYKFYAFSSRFAANPRSCSTLVADSR